MTDEEERVGGPFRIGIWWGLIGSFDGAHKRPPGGRSGAGSLLVTLPFPAAEMQGGSGRPLDQVGTLDDSLLRVSPAPLKPKSKRNPQIPADRGVEIERAGP